VGAELPGGRVDAAAESVGNTGVRLDGSPDPGRTVASDEVRDRPETGPPPFGEQP
jgi:hypothetical protein